MSEYKEYTIVVRNKQSTKRVVVSYEIYKAYHAEREHARYLESEARKNEIPLEWFDEHGVYPEYAETSPLPLDSIIHQEQIAKLYTALHSLPESEQRLIYALFFERQGERQLAEIFGISQPIVNRRKQRILKKLKNILEI